MGSYEDDEQTVDVADVIVSTCRDALIFVFQMIFSSFVMTCQFEPMFPEEVKNNRMILPWTVK